MKSKDDLNAMKEEAETVSRNPQALTDEELEQVTGGSLSFSGSVKYNGTVYSSWDAIPGGATFTGTFDGKRCTMRRNKAYNIDGVTVLGTTAVFYPLNGEDSDGETRTHYIVPDPVE